MYLFDRNIRLRNIKSQSWQLVALFEKLAGVWPYQRKFVQRPLQILHFFSLLSMIFALFNGSRTMAAGDVDKILENTFLAVFTFAVTCMQVLNSIGQCKRRKVYERVVKHYDATNSPPEDIAVLGESADRGAKFFVAYVCVACAFVTIFQSTPMVRALYDFAVGHDDQLNIDLPIAINYGVDHRKYWYCVMPVFVLFFLSGLVAAGSFALSFMLQVRHARALFVIIRMRLDKAVELADQEDESSSMMVSAVDLHVECFEVIKMIEEIYSTFMFLLLVGNSASIALGLHMVTRSLDDPFEVLRFVCLFSLLTMHFYVVFFHGQMITDASSTINDARRKISDFFDDWKLFWRNPFRYHCKWLDLPGKPRKLFVMMMMMQSTNACQITGAKLFPLSMETFSKMFQAGLSYYTVFEK